MRNVDLLVGIPSCGKTTHRLKEYNQDEIFIISRDDIRTQLMSEYDLTYFELFMKPKSSDPFIHDKLGVKTPEGTWSNLDRVNENLIARFESQKMEAINQLQQGKRIIVDLTNLTEVERKEAKDIFDGIENVSFNVIVFEFHNNLPLIKKLNEDRGVNEGKVIPEFVIDKMVEKFEPVGEKEGFNIQYIDGLKGLKNSLGNKKTNKNKI